MISDIIDKYPYLVDDDEINPLLQRMSGVECLLNATISQKKVKSNRSLDQAYTTRYTDELASISNQILTIITDRSMYQSIARLERGKKLL